jgi:hypothetical protein
MLNELPMGKKSNLTRLERIARKVTVNPNSGCHEWNAGRKRSQYGRLWLNGRNVGSHRVAYEIAKGPIPEGMYLDHLCRNPCCCNPDHLEAVTPRENILRSPTAPPALNALKTHCPVGHLLEGDNLDAHALKNGRRACKECGRQKCRDYHYRTRDKRLARMAVNRAKRKVAHQKRLDASCEDTETV